MISLLGRYKAIKAELKDSFIIGDLVDYSYSGHDMTGEIVYIHPFTSQIKVRSSTGKEYWIFFDSIQDI